MERDVDWERATSEDWADRLGQPTEPEELEDASDSDQSWPWLESASTGTWAEPNTLSWVGEQRRLAEYPGPWRWASMKDRLVAAAIDLCLLVLSLGAVVLASIAFGPDSQQYWVTTRIWEVVVVAYQPITWWRLGGTIGQRARHLRVLRTGSLKTLSLRSALIRYVVQLGVVSVLLFVQFALFWLAPVAHGVSSRINGERDARKRTLWDRAAGAVVIQFV